MSGELEGRKREASVIRRKIIAEDRDNYLIMSVEKDCPKCRELGYTAYDEETNTFTRCPCVRIDGLSEVLDHELRIQPRSEELAKTEEANNRRDPEEADSSGGPLKPRGGTGRT